MVDVQRRRLSRQERVWAAFAIPGITWLVMFFLVAIYAVAAIAFGGVNPQLRGTPVPEWNPFRWDFSAMSDMLDRVVNGPLRQVFLRTFLFVALSLAGCIAIGFPVAYFVARKAGRRRGLLLGLLVLPFWISYLMRMLAWTNLLQPDGLVNKALEWVGLMDTPRNWLDGSWSTVVWGLVYGYVPFFILPLYSSLERLDGRLIEAGRDLGAGPVRTFLSVTLPLSVPGLMAASVVTILPMFGDYYTNSYLTSGSPSVNMVGNQIEDLLRGSGQPNKGAALVLILMALLFVLMVYYLVSMLREQRRAER